MSCRKSLSCLGISALLWLATPALGWAQVGFPCASFGTPCAAGCQTHHCPPAYQHCSEGPPHIHFKCGCPHPIANPCEVPHWGFYETCWLPWPYPPNYTHCPVPPPASMVHLNPYGTQTQTLPPVRSTQPGGVLQQPALPGPMPPMPGQTGSEEVIPLPPPRKGF
jgi:hypothetical protein